MASGQAPPPPALAAPTAAVPEKKEKKKPSQEKPTSLPDPPETVKDSDGIEWTRGRMLGSGGFARVYDAISSKGEMRAFKVIAKKHLQSRKTRQKVSRVRDSVRDRHLHVLTNLSLTAILGMPLDPG